MIGRGLGDRVCVGGCGWMWEFGMGVEIGGRAVGRAGRRRGN